MPQKAKRKGCSTKVTKMFHTHAKNYERGGPKRGGELDFVGYCTVGRLRGVRPMDDQIHVPHTRLQPRTAPKPLPKAPSSAEMARRILANANAKPEVRFDSADYYMNKWLQKRQACSASQGASQQQVEKALSHNDDLEHQNQVLLLPPPLNRHLSHTSS
jgi:hypothetical protein